MTEVLLKELNSNDINWLRQIGRRQALAMGTKLISAGKPLDCLYLVIEGSLVSAVPQINDNPLSRAFAALDDNQNLMKSYRQTVGVEIARLASGEVIGEIALVNLQSSTTDVIAIENSQVLAIPLLQLEAKLETDVGFAARFYKAIAILIADRLEAMIARLGRSKLAPESQVKDVLYLLGELNDSDLDWLIAHGDRKVLATNTTLIEQGSCVDAFYLILSGQVALSVTEDNSNPLTRIFATIENRANPAKEIGRISKGEMIGETIFIDARLPAFTATTTKETIALAIDRSVLSTKLQQDLGFAARFYRTISALSAARREGISERLAHSRRMYQKGQSLNSDVTYTDELNSVLLDRIAIAGKRFDWMLERTIDTPRFNKDADSCFNPG
jgi:bacteriocin-type transport-associated protein